MSTNLIDFLKETMGDPSQLTPEKMKKLVEETMKFFQEIQGKFDSKDPKAKEEALATASELKQALEVQMEALMKQTGMDSSQLSALADTANYTSEEKEALDDMKMKLQEFRSSDSAKTAPRRKPPKMRLIG